jgi:hypothetical protein
MQNDKYGIFLRIYFAVQWAVQTVQGTSHDRGSLPNTVRRNRRWRQRRHIDINIQSDSNIRTDANTNIQSDSNVNRGANINKHNNSNIRTDADSNTQM